MTIPKEIKEVISKLEKAGFEAYIVGGCVRDFLLEESPKDWDVTTNAKPEEIEVIFPKSFYKNKFLTVTVQTNSNEETLKEIEVTTYRSEAEYSDKRHPNEVKYAKTLEEDLARRDFTVNAMALTEEKGKTKVIDPFSGKKDLKAKVIKTVGDPNERFNEDALRMLRAVRFATTLGFKIEKKTAEAIKKNSIWLEAVSKERTRDEFLKIVMADNAAEGVELLRELDLLKYIVPELLENYGVKQNKHHIYDCYQHALKALEFTAKKKLNIYVRMAALLHDIAKPRVKTGEGLNSTFYNHEIVGAKITFQILNRLKFSKKDVEKITKLVRYHLFYYNVDEVGEASVRRLVKNVGTENIEELMLVRQADRIGSGVPKAEPYKLRHLKYLIDKVSQDPISAKMLKINGNDLIKVLDIKPGPKIGQILDILLGYVLDDPKKNDKEFLEKETEKLAKLDDKKLKSLAENSKEEKGVVETKRDEMTKQKYWVT
jgi:poly(A) polymerase/tRNA nucleotidyltransferase (CCA-adding enzyme)